MNKEKLLVEQDSGLPRK